MVDDEEPIRDAIKDLIERHSPALRVLVAASAAEAIPRLKGNKVDLLITDQYMPGMSGLELIVMAHVDQPSLPCFLVTGHHDVDLAQAAINRAQVFGFFYKPLDPADFLVRLQAALDKLAPIWGRIPPQGLAK